MPQRDDERCAGLLGMLAIYVGVPQPQPTDFPTRMVRMSGAWDD